MRRACCRARCDRRPCGRRGGRSRLARPAPEGLPVVVPLPAHADRRAAARAGQPRLAVDLLEAGLVAVLCRALHPRPRGGDDRADLVVAQLPGGPPRIDPRREAALDLPEVADPRDGPLIEQAVTDRTRRIVLAQAAQEAGLVELV